jgi:hypothetical protein
VAFFDQYEIADLRELAESAMNTTVQIWRSPGPVGNRTGPPANTGRTSRAYLFTPSTQPQIALLADLGAGRGSRLGHLPYGTDVNAGDELHVGAVIYQVLGRSRPYTKVICALAEVNPT